MQKNTTMKYTRIIISGKQFNKNNKPSFSLISFVGNDKESYKMQLAQFNSKFFFLTEQ